MPLSEDEQRILRQIEEHLQRDSGFGRTIHTVRHGSRRALMLSVAGTVLALLMTVVLLGVSPWLSFAVFVGALACAIVAVRHGALLGEQGLANWAASARVRAPQPSPGPSDDDLH
ncbi:MAG: DUF3040 domain-containing protein [Ilumatobacteraceae bacterium]